MPRPRVLTCGETMALLDAEGDGELAYGLPFRLRIAGAESNFAIALSRLGVDVTWISAVGEDPFGDLVLATLAQQGLDLHCCRRVPDTPTGVFFKWRVDGRTCRSFYRTGSAAGALRPADVPDAALEGLDWVHLTGITAGLSPSALDTVVDLGARARSRSIPVSFDLNYRPGLWRDAAEARVAADRVLEHARWLLLSDDEASTVFGVHGPDDLERLAGGRPDLGIILRAGSGGAHVADGGRMVHVPIPRLIENVADEVGAGDAFAAGFVHGLLGGLGVSDAVARAHTLAAHSLSGTGDWETLPSLDELHAAESETDRSTPGPE